MLEVATVWAPRPDHPKWRTDYLEMLELQRRTAERVGHRHVVVTDVELPGFNAIRASLPRSLMHAILEGQLAYLRQWSNKHAVVLLDIDCVVCRSLDEAFDGTFDIGLTNRDNPAAPIQNGAMYFKSGAKPAALALFARALELCGEHWGGDQEAIAQAVAPVPHGEAREMRFGVRLAFLSTGSHNHSPKCRQPVKLMAGRFIEHFKGETKSHAPGFARRLLERPVTA